MLNAWAYRIRHTPEYHTDASSSNIKDIRWKTRKRYSTEDKIRIVLAGLQDEDSIAELCRHEALHKTNITHDRTRFRCVAG